MKISRLFEQHQKFKSQGLSGSFGDGYLIAHNRIFKKIREAALRGGYKFSSERDEAYETFPLLQLEALLKTKVFPYSNNVVAFESMTAVQLEALSWEDVDGNLKKNFVFHEACHGVVRLLAQKNLGPARESGDLESQRRFVLRMLLEESCSNTSELLGVIDAADPIHRIFYEMNSYVCEFESRTHLKNAMNEIGADILIKFMVLAYLQANFLRPAIEDRQFQEMIRLVTDRSLDPKHIKTLRALGKIAFNLSERFRVQTTSFHLRLAGVKTPPEDLFDFDFLRVLAKEPGFPAFLQEFASTLS